MKTADSIKGKTIDAHSRCEHYHSALDIIAVKMKCCNEYYACIDCHNETAHHTSQVWKKDDFDTRAILCGNCYYELTIQEYLDSHYQCPNCRAAFNLKCSNHNHFYFEV